MTLKSTWLRRVSC